MTDSKQYCLKWNNFSDNILTSLESLRGDEDFVDVTIACEGQSLKAHKVVLSACSQYIKKLLKENPCAHPIIILKDVALIELRALLSFMYNGQVMIEEDRIPKLLRTAELLEIRGLSDLTTVKEHDQQKSSLPSNGGIVATVMDSSASPDPSTPTKLPPRVVDGVEGWIPEPGEGESDDEEYEDDEDDEDEEDETENRTNHNSVTLPEFSLPSDVSHKAPRDLQVTTVDPAHFTARNHHSKDDALPNKPCNALQPHGVPHTNIGDGHETPVASRAMLPIPGQRAVDIAARVSQMEDNLLPGDVLVIGETHITPARCMPRSLKPPPPPIEQPPPTKQQCFGTETQNDGRLSLEMSLRLQVQRKIEAERLRAMERLRQAEAAFNEPIMNTPMDCSNFPVLTNGVHAQENGGIPGHRDEPPGLQALSAQQPSIPPPPGPPTIPLPLSPDLQLKMLMCRDFKKYTNMLLVAVFGREVLATHCLNGSKGSAKPRLDTEKVTRVIATVMEKFDVPASTVREAIRVKLNNEDKLKKRSKRAAHPLL